jgi:hypothetical protein
MGTPEGIIDPPLLTIDPKELILKGFRWLENLRPKNKDDIFTKIKQAESN